MHVMSLVVRLQLEKSASARIRRLSIESIVDTIHQHFNVSVAEVGGAGPEITLAATCVGRTRGRAKDVLERVAEALCSCPGAVLVQPPQFVSH